MIRGFILILREAGLLTENSVTLQNSGLATTGRLPRKSPFVMKSLILHGSARRLFNTFHRWSGLTVLVFFALATSHLAVKAVADVQMLVGH